MSPDTYEHLYDEVLRLREKLHDLTSRVNTLEVHTEGMRKTLERVERKVDAISTAEQIADAVARHDRSRQTLTLNKGQWAAVIGGCAFFVASVLRGLFGIEVGP